MVIPDLTKINFDELNDNIKEVYKNYSNYKDYKLFTHYHYINNEPVGVIYGWTRKNYLNIDIVYVSEEHRKKGIATQMLLEVIKEMTKRKDIKLIMIELKKCYGKYLLDNVVNKLGFSIDIYFKLFKGRLIYYKNIKEV